jgi:hypothetical protein
LLANVDDAVGRICGNAKAVEVTQVSTDDLRAGTGERLGTRGRTAESDHAMASADEFRNEKGTNKAGGAR